jgi:acetylornithine deacetylase
LASRRPRRSGSRTPAEARVLRAVEQNSREMIGFLQELVRAESITGKEESGQELVVDALKKLGAKIDRWNPSRRDLNEYPGFSAGERRLGRRPNVVGRFGRRGGKTLAFNGHIDVVPPGDPLLWEHQPFGGDVIEGRLYGRGACDMKAGLAAEVFALRAILEAGPALRETLLLESVIGEESGGIGTLASILRGYAPDATVIAEPTGLQIVTTQAGCLNFRLRIKGKAAHGASRYLGISAVEKFQPVLNALLTLEGKRRKMRRHPLFAGVPNAVPLSVGRVRSGNWDSTVPEELVAEGRYGVWPGESLDSAKKQFERALAAEAALDPWLSRNPPEVRWFGPQWEPSEIPQDHWLARLVERAYVGALGGTPLHAGTTGGTDMRLYTNVAGVPAILFGPGDDSVAHFRDEWVDTRDVADACKVYALVALNWNMDK